MIRLYAETRPAWPAVTLPRISSALDGAMTVAV